MIFQRDKYKFDFLKIRIIEFIFNIFVSSRAVLKPWKSKYIHLLENKIISLELSVILSFTCDQNMVKISHFWIFIFYWIAYLLNVLLKWNVICSL